MYQFRTLWILQLTPFLSCYIVRWLCFDLIFKSSNVYVCLLCSWFSLSKFSKHYFCTSIRFWQSCITVQVYWINWVELNVFIHVQACHWQFKSHFMNLNEVWWTNLFSVSVHDNSRTQWDIALRFKTRWFITQISAAIEIQMSSSTFKGSCHRAGTDEFSQNFTCWWIWSSGMTL